MKKNSIFLSILLSVTCAISSLVAQVKLPAIVSSNMVLQRNAKVKLWGWASPKEKIKFQFSWQATPANISADENGNWMTEVQTSNSIKPQSISITSEKSTINLTNILFGEVWLCSGQSNMQQSLKGYFGQPTFGTNQAIINAKNPNLRLFSVKRIASKKPEKDLIEFDSWQEASTQNVGEFSAVAYYFGQQLQQTLGVPVGMIHSSWGGSSVQAWLSEEAISQYQSVNLDTVDLQKKTNQIPTALYNSMIYPLLNYRIKGVLWYQGESNRLEPDKYYQMFPAMVSDWRKRWGNGDFPFYYAQIAPYWYNKPDAFNDYENSAFIRETQLKCKEKIPNSGMAVTMDIGEEYIIHPAKKKEVADRLLYLALNKTYDFKDLDSEGPEFKEKEVKGNQLVLTFSHAENGLYTPTKLSGFEIAGADKVFYPAEANIEKFNSVVLKSDKVANPIEARYCWRNWTVGTLFDSTLLPASSFRTDNWTDAKKGE